MTELERLAAQVRDLTTARILTGRTGTAYRTATQLALRADHALAQDAVAAELALPPELVDAYGVVVVGSRAADHVQHLRRPDLGRRLSPEGAALVRARCARRADVQIVLGDGLSAAAVHAQVPGLLPLLVDGAAERGWSVGQVVAVRHCRVGVVNEIGALLDPTVVLLLIGERPGLGTAEALSVYLAHRPRPGHTDAERNLVAGIHARGLSHTAAAERVLDLVALMRERATSGVALKEVDRDVLPPGASA